MLTIYIISTLFVVVVALVTQLCATLYDPVDCSPPGSSVCGILQARILEWIEFLSPEDLPDPGIKPESPALQTDALPSEPLGKTYAQKGNICLKTDHFKAS